MAKNRKKLPKVTQAAVTALAKSGKPRLVKVQEHDQRNLLS
jgi:hypothetical protein